MLFVVSSQLSVVRDPTKRLLENGEWANGPESNKKTEGQAKANLV